MTQTPCIAFPLTCSSRTTTKKILPPIFRFPIDRGEMDVFHNSYVCWFHTCTHTPSLIICSNTIYISKNMHTRREKQATKSNKNNFFFLFRLAIPQLQKCISLCAFLFSICDFFLRQQISLLFEKLRLMFGEWTNFFSFITWTTRQQICASMGLNCRSSNWINGGMRTLWSILEDVVFFCFFWCVTHKRIHKREWNTKWATRRRRRKKKERWINSNAWRNSNNNKSSVKRKKTRRSKRRIDSP